MALEVLRTMRSILVLAFTCALAACATSADMSRKSSPPDMASRATVIGHEERETPYTWQSFIPVMVDSKAVKHSFFANHVDTVVNVDPGARRFVVRAAFNAGIGSGGIREAIVLLVAQIEAGKSYRLNGRVRDNQMVVWLEDLATGTRVTEESAANWTSVASQSYTPIFIPARK